MSFSFRLLCQDFYRGACMRNPVIDMACKFVWKKCGLVRASMKLTMPSMNLNGKSAMTCKTNLFAVFCLKLFPLCLLFDILWKDFSDRKENIWETFMDSGLRQEGARQKGAATRGRISLTLTLTLTGSETIWQPFGKLQNVALTSETTKRPFGKLQNVARPFVPRPSVRIPSVCSI